MARLLAGVVALAAACSQPVDRKGPQGPGPGSAVEPVAAPVDAPEPSEEERLAAIQKAMNELDEAAQGCWAAVAAAERFDVEGELVALVDIAPAAAKASLVRDTARNPRLAACLVALLEQYRWAPPLHGQAIQLPFQFRAPKGGQNVVDRRLVPWKQQGKVAVSVLLDEANTGNAAASMFDLKIDAGGTTGMRKTDRAELWFFDGDAEIKSANGKVQKTLGMGFAYVPAGGAREIIAPKDEALAATLVVVPGGREGSARMGALPTQELGTRAVAVGPTLVESTDAKTYARGMSKYAIVVEPATIKASTVAATHLDLAAGTQIPEHVHEKETELLYVTSGEGTMTVNGVAIAVTPHSVIQVPPNTKHGFVAKSGVVAIQYYTPAGPEQRFKK